MFAPYADDAEYGVHPVFEKYHYPHFAPTAIGLVVTLSDREYPWFYSMSPRIDKIAENIASLMQEIHSKYEKLNKVALLYTTDLFGILHHQYTRPLIEDAGFDIVIDESFDVGVPDLSPIIKRMKAAGVDCMIAQTMFNETILLTKQSIELDFNPKVFYTMVGTHFGFYPDLI